MALKAEYATRDEAPEALRPHLVEVEGKHFLQLEGNVHGYVPNARHAEFRDTNISLLKERDALTAELSPWKSLGDFAKVQADIKKAQAIDDQRLIEAGKADELVEQKIAAHKQETADQLKQKDVKIKALEESGAAKDAKLAELTIWSQIDTETRDASLGVQPGAVSVLRQQAQYGDHKGRRWVMNEKHAAVCVEPNGSPCWSPTDPEKLLSMKEWVADVIRAHPFLSLKSSGGGATGSGAGGAGTTNIDPKLPPSERLKLARRGAA